MPPELGEGVRQAAARQGTSVSTWLTEAAADKLRNELLGAALDQREAEDGPFTQTELDEAASRLGPRAAFGCDVKAILDAGALVAVDRRNRLIGAQLRVLQQQGTPIRVSSAVVGQVWRDGRKQANLARVLAGVGIEALGKDDGKRIGELLALSGSADIVGAHA